MRYDKASHNVGLKTLLSEGLSEPEFWQVLHTPGPEMYPGMCTYCFTLKKANLIICPVFIRASNFGTRSMKYEAK